MFERITNIFKSRAAAPKVLDPTDSGSIVSLEVGVFSGIANGSRYNPDDLVGRQGLAIYAKMRNDEQVKAVCQFKRDVIVSRGWTLDYDTQSSLSATEREKRVRIVSKMLDRMRGSFTDALNVIATGREFGFSLTEKVYGPIDIDGTRWSGVVELLGRNPSSFDFITDEYGELIQCEQVGGSRRIPIDLAKFVWYVHAPEFDPYFGRSDLRAAYRSWYFKDVILRYWAMYMEKMGGGFLVATPKDGDASPRLSSADHTILQNALAQAKTSAAIVMPPGMELTVQYPAASDGYERACTWHDLAIARALLVPNLVGVTASGQTGAYAQSQTQLEAFAWTVRADSERLAATINNDLIRDIGERNWADGEYPRFQFKPLSEERVRWVVDTWTKLVASGSVVVTEEDEARLRSIMDMPARNDSSVVLVDPVKEQARKDALEAQKAAAAGAQSSSDDDEDVDDDESQREKKTARMRAAFRAQENRTKEQRALMARALALAEERVNFAVIDKRQASQSEALTKEVAASVAVVSARIMGSDARLAALIDEDVRDIADIGYTKSEKGRLKGMYQHALSAAWAMGQNMALDEIAKASRKQMARGKPAPTVPKSKPVSIRDTASQYFEANGFRMAGNVSDAVRSLIQQELQNAVKSGKSVKETRTSIWNRLVAKGLTSKEEALGVETDSAVLSALNELWADTEEGAAAYLNTLARTNLFEAMNEARYAEFTDPALDGFVLALRYSAILDQRTTDICEHLDGSTYAADSEVWNTYRPPNHYNCRSILVPITEVDGWDASDESDWPTVEPQAGFK